MLRVVREGDFIELKSDDEYRRIREEMKKSGGRRL
jgi:hypothetical protein